MNAVRALARAKINLNLHVVGKREDGYHEIDSLVTFAEFGDEIVVRENPGGPPFGIDVDGPFSATMMAATPSPADNLVVKAAAGLRALAERQGIKCTPVHIRLTKNLPIAAGIGGGSADAAATIGALSKLWSLPPDLPDRHHLLSLLGADLPMCLASRPLRATGIGERLERVEMPAMSMLLVNPRVPVETVSVYRHELLGRSGPQGIPADNLEDHLRQTRNDLEAPARALAPKIGSVLGALVELEGCWLARMSGSGATCFGLFADDADAAEGLRTVKSAHPDWWVVDTMTVAS